MADLNEFAAFYADKGVSSYVLYGNSVFDIKHGAKPVGSSDASSKCGAGLRMKHDKSEMEGGIYGNLGN